MWNTPIYILEVKPGYMHGLPPVFCILSVLHTAIDLLDEGFLCRLVNVVILTHIFRQSVLLYLVVNLPNARGQSILN